ncbi:MAG: PilZ domain-containing protein [Myxococcota bacterium]
MEPERRLLIVDTPDGELQQLAMDLLGRDFEVHYAGDIDEAQLLAAELRGQINAVLFTADVDMERVPQLAARFGVAPDALIPFGLRPAERVVKALHHHGVRWQLWDDPPDESIRFVISGVLHDHDPFELRYHLRVPTRLAGRFSSGDRKFETTIRDVGLGGACLVGGDLGEDGARGELAFEFSGRTLRLPTRTAWSAPATGDDLSIGGVAFQEIDHESGEVLDALLESVIARHRIEPGD